MSTIINISMPDDLVKRVNRQAVLEDRPRSAIFREALRLYFTLKEGGGEADSPPARRGSPQAVLAALEAGPAVSSADAKALLQVIEQGRQPVRFENPLEPRGGRRIRKG